MINIKKYIIPIAIVVLISNTGCKKEFFTDSNINEDAPLSVPPATLLSTVEGSLAYAQGGDLSRYTSLLTQQTFGASRQSSAYYAYTFTSDDINNLWGNLYTTVMENCKTLIDSSDAKGYAAYAGSGRILMAYSLMLTVDSWGDIPYSQAFSGLNNLQPAYDDDAAIYAVIGSLIDAGIGNLTATNAGALTPGGEDILFGGDASMWIKFGHAIKARLAIHQSKVNSSFAQTALDEIALSFATGENAIYIFGETETSSNPWYQFNQQRTDISFSDSYLGSKLLTANDPRFSLLIDTVAEQDGFGGLAEYYGGISGAVEFVTYDELQFMKAEALIRLSNDVAGAQVAFQEGIHANFAKLGSDTSASNPYVLLHGTLNVAGGDSAISQIVDEEYIALYLNPEAWTMFRRTGFPVLTPVTGSAVPRRLLYPQSEYSYNGPHTPQSSLFTPLIFWVH